MTIAKALLRRLVPPIIGFAPFRHLGPISEAMRKTAYRLRYLAWFNQAGIKKRLLQTPRPFGHANRQFLYAELFARYQLSATRINFLEFGVAAGDSMRWWVSRNGHPASAFIGFDTFTGLPEDWGRVTKGTFSTGGSVPSIDDERCRFVKGLFQHTLVPTLGQIQWTVARTVVHIDADLYSSTLYVLMAVNAHLKEGDIVMFDEFGSVCDEFRAFLDFRAATGRELTPIAGVNCGDVIAFEVANSR